jgi:DNA-binding NarL/FixJ family response regulator
MNDNRTAVILVNLPLWAEALRGLAESSGIGVVGSACAPEQAFDLIAQLQPGVFITEIDSEEGEELDLDVVRTARRIDPELRVIVLSNAHGRSSIISAFGAGADMYVLHDANPDDMAAAMRQLFDQSVFIAADWAVPSALQSVRNAFAALTRREFEILRLVAYGHTNGTMASMLCVTEQTIKFHLSNIYRKLGVSNRTEASRWAQTHGLLPLVPAEAETIAERVA